MMDTWIILRDIEAGGERSRDLMILKSRGMAHSNPVKRFQLTGKGLMLDVPAANASRKRVGSTSSQNFGTMSSRKVDREGSHG